MTHAAGTLEEGGLAPHTNVPTGVILNTQCGENNSESDMTVDNMHYHLLWLVVLAMTIGVIGKPDPSPLPVRHHFKGFATGLKHSRVHRKIINGRFAKIKDYPYQVYLQAVQRNRTSFSCGGAIIGSRHILTAAHCVNKAGVIGEFALAGNENINSLNVFPLRVIKKTFYPRTKREKVEADIAVLMVDRVIPIGKMNIKAVKIETNRRFNRNVVCSVAGWGDTEDDSGQDLLKAIKVPIVSQKMCLLSYPRELPDDLLCAGYYMTGAADTCQGDSGGPLVCGKRLVGIVKGGRGCALPLFPGTYTDVSYYAKWIQNVVKIDLGQEKFARFKNLFG